jgi:phosphoglycolate phosphatase
MKFCVIYDLDGTLIDSRRDLATAVNLMRQTFGLEPLSLEMVTSFIGNGARKLVERAVAGQGIDVDNALSLMKGFYAEHMVDETVLYSGVAEGVEKLHAAGIPQTIITNKHQEAVAVILRKLGVLQYFDLVIGGGGDFQLKPEPESLLHVVEQTGSLAKDSWMVGDHYTDLLAGKRAGMKCCHTAYGFGDIKDENFDLEVHDFSDFTQFVLASNLTN